MQKIDLHKKVELMLVGNEKTPVIVIDDFSAEPQKCIDLALKEEFQQETKFGPYYPGIRALVKGEYGNAVLGAIADLVRLTYKVPSHKTMYPHGGFYSLVNTPVNKLEFLQSIPHFDSTIPDYFAVMHYLNPGEFGGTAFYRHIPTGYELITESNVKTYLSAAQQFIDNQENVEIKYFTQSTDHYALIDKLEYKQNRVVIYPGNLLHSGFIDNPSRDLNDNPQEGRLTANFFIYFK